MMIEPTKGRVTLTRDEAEKIIVPGEFVPTIRQGDAATRPVVLDQNYPRETILALADEGLCEVAGPAAALLDHRVVVFMASGPVFVRTIETPG